jgi:hypothetical protein
LDRLDAILARWSAAGIQGVQVGKASELAARIARQAEQIDRFEDYAARCRQAYTAAETPVLLARYRRLHEDEQPIVTTELASGSQLSAALRRVTTDLARQEGTLAVAQRSLELLLESAAAKRGFLFGIQRGWPALIAADELLPDGMQSFVQEYYVSTLREIQTRALTQQLPDAPDNALTQSIKPPEPGFASSNSPGETFRALALYHRAGGAKYLVALAVLSETASTLRFPSAGYLSAIGEALYGCADLERIHAPG